MELAGRLQQIEFRIKQLKTKCDTLENENAQLKIVAERLQKEIETKNHELVNLAETNKISKLAQSAHDTDSTTQLKTELAQLIKEIDECLVLVKQ